MPCDAIGEHGGLLAEGGEESHVLQENGVYAHFFQTAHGFYGVGDFMIEDNRVHRGIDFRIELMGVIAKAGNIANGVSCCVSSTEVLWSYVYGIGTVVNSRDAAFQILCRSQ